jgi:RNA 2',3'-cyclic 3'-phosphodiesterase
MAGSRTHRLRRRERARARDAVRLFVAARPSGAALADLGRLVDTLAVSRAGARVTDSERWHLTVTFLGDVPADRVDTAAAAIRAAAVLVAPPRLRLAGGGTFGHGRSAILWSGITGATPDDLVRLRALARSVRHELRRAGLPYDDGNPYRPHLTLARPGDAVDLTEDLAALRAHTGPVFTVGEITLYRSDRGPAPVYTELAVAPLSGQQ